MMISFGRTLLYVGLKLNVGKRFNFKKMSTHNVVAVLQLNCTHDIDENFKISEQLIRKSKSISPSVKVGEVFFLGTKKFSSEYVSYCR